MIGLRSSIDTKIVVLVDEKEESRPSKWRVSSIPLLRRIDIDKISFHFVSTSQSISKLKLQEWMDVSSPHTVLLYPSDASIPLDGSHSRFSVGKEQKEEKEEENTHSPNAVHTLVVLDGSWRSVQQLLYHNPLLHPKNMRHVRLDLKLSSYTSYFHRFGLRVEPAPSCVSTAEAIAFSLLLIEKPTNQIGNLILEEFKRFVESNVTKTRKTSNSHNSMEFSDDEGFISPESGKDIPSIPLLDESRLVDYNHCEENESKKSYRDNDGVQYRSSYQVESGENFGDSDQRYLLLPSKGVREKKVVSKADKRKHNREKERKRRKHKVGR